MKPQKNTLIDRTLYPELDLLLWDNAERFIKPKEAFHTYEQRWRFVEQNKLTPQEINLIKHLTDDIGNGLFLAA